jgi:tyrosine-protein phosphatase SIW14
MSTWARWGLSALVAVIVIGSPILCFRMTYSHGKRLREIVPGLVYRSGQMTADGFTDAISRHHIRTVINLQDDNPDPDLHKSFFSSQTVKESDLCRRLGVNFLTISPDLVPRRFVPARRPRAIEEFLAVMDDEANYPVLIHCKAGLHRTGVLSAVYRMEYQGWSREAAFCELRAHGFGWFKCTSANDYVKQYVLTYRPGLRLVTDPPPPTGPHEEASLDP